MPSYTIFKHHAGRDIPSFEIADRATSAEVEAYALGLLAANPDYDRLEIVHTASGYDEVVERPEAAVDAG